MKYEGVREEEREVEHMEEKRNAMVMHVHP